jgi:hypothetical protein
VRTRNNRRELPLGLPCVSTVNPMSYTIAGLIAFVLLIGLAIIVLANGRMSETGHGSRVKDLREILDMLDSAKTRGRRVLIIIYYLRALFRGSYWTTMAAIFGGLCMLAAAIFGGGWEIARQMLCDVLRFIETMVNGKATSCEAAVSMPAPAHPP